MLKLDGYVAHMIDEKYISILFGKPEGETPSGGPRRRWEDNIKMYLKKNWMLSRLYMLGIGCIAMAASFEEVI